MIRSKRGAYFFLIDVFLVVLIFFITAITILSFRSSEPSLQGIDQQIDTVTYELFNVEIRDYDSPIMTQLKLPTGAIYEEGWNNQLTVDELVVLLETHGYSVNATSLIQESVNNLPKKYGFNYSIIINNVTTPVYARDSLVSQVGSQVKLSQRKISWPRANLTNTYEPAITEVTLWQ
ncbi:MAG: hypothetical protein KC535_04080 [Nanoarchaeota archaeon]|nr:hypothetical protein [Nanoarchaeota archaeon]